MEQDARNAIFLRLREALLARGAKDAARRLDIVRSVLDTQDDAALNSLALRHCREFDLDPAWILHGQGEPAVPETPVAWAPVFAMSATHPRTGRWQLREIERIALAPSILSPSRFVTRMDSPALEPCIHKGAYLVVDTAQDTIGPPNVAPQAADAATVPFAMDIQGQGLVVRMLPSRRNPAQAQPAACDTGEAGAGYVRDGEHARIVGRVVWVAQTL